MRHDISAAAVAIGCFVLLGFAVLLVLWPRRDWEFSLSLDQFISTYLEPVDDEPLALHLIERDLALHIGRSAELNRRQLTTLMTVFRVGSGRKLSPSIVSDPVYLARSQNVNKWLVALC